MQSRHSPAAAIRFSKQQHDVLKSLTERTESDSFVSAFQSVAPMKTFGPKAVGFSFFSAPSFFFFFPPSFLFFFSPGVSGVQSRLAPLPEATTLRGGLQLHNTRTADTDSQNTARLLQALTERSRQDSGPPSPLPPLLSTATAGHHHHRRLLLNVVFISVSVCLSVCGLFV